MSASSTVKRPRYALRAIASAFILLPLGIAASARGDAKSANSACNYYNYHHDESRNSAGAGRCSSDCDCDGMRSCGTSGSCQGEARPALSSCNDVRYHWNEAWNTAGPGRCQGDCDCDGLRTCVSGVCRGKAR